ncbi:hypothetical protein X953_18370 [Virgibacillus sp. SK37]|nr:hypothetical protein X953_18370 [Virgibacillus sp. SK37]
MLNDLIMYASAILAVAVVVYMACLHSLLFLGIR